MGHGGAGRGAPESVAPKSVAIVARSSRRNAARDGGKGKPHGRVKSVRYLTISREIREISHEFHGLAAAESFSIVAGSAPIFSDDPRLGHNFAGVPRRPRLPRDRLADLSPPAPSLLDPPRAAPQSILAVARSTSRATNKPCDRPTVRPTDRLPARPWADKPTDRPKARPTDRLTARPNDRPTARPTDRPTDWATDRPRERQTDMAMDQPTVRPTGRATDRATDRPSDRPTVRPINRPRGRARERARERATGRATD